MKRVWKPLDVGGLRLYRVAVYAVGGREGKDVIVAAKRPRHAEELMSRIYPPGFTISAYPLSVYQPVGWWTEGVPCCRDIA